MATFNFDLSKCLIKLELGVLLEPKILKANYSRRIRNGFLYIINGHYKYFSDAGTFTAEAGDFIYLPTTDFPYAYEFTTDNDAPLKHIQVEFSVIDKETSIPLGFAKHPTLIKKESIVLGESMNNIAKLYPSPSLSSKHEMLSELLKIISIVNENEEQPTTSLAEKSVAPAVRYIEHNYTNKISSSELAKLCALSESQLRRNFQTAHGTSPNAYKQELLLKMAKRLLKIDEFNVSEIAEMLGFYDIYAFSHFFTKYEGVSPIAYRKKVISK